MAHRISSMRYFRRILKKPYESSVIIFVSLSLALACSGIRADVVTDSFGKHKFDKPPQRVVVTDWALLEQMLALGVEPVGAPELDLYRHYVRLPELPKGIQDIGLRRSPNLKAIKALKPDVIVIGTDQKALARPFSRIGRVMYYKSFSDKYRTNGKKASVRFTQLAELFKKQALAKSTIQAIDAEISLIKKELIEHFNGELPRLTLIRFSSEKKCLVYGENSIASHVLKRLGIEPGLASTRSKWGEKELTIAKLREIEQGVVLYIQPVDNPEIFESTIWQQLPMVMQSRVISMEPVWSYGGVMSILYHARAIRDALISVDVESKHAFN